MSGNRSISCHVGTLGALLAIMLIMGVWTFAMSPSAAQTTPSSKMDVDQPIEITAESLEVEQNQNIAIFRGNVVALQGEMRLQADQLTVHYRNSENSDAGVNAISRIDAEGSVFIASTQETAQGDMGVYNVENGLITLTQNVVLTRGENVIRGNSLRLNIVTGQSVVDGGLGATRPGGRVHSLFVPKRSAD
jgi:lipopolysaccharide export system protein LptA